jgi:hypothetical protein
LVRSVERDYVGWDLEAERDSVVLKIEVKGLSGNVVVFDVTPNEYIKMQQEANYRICVVNSVLSTNKILRVFSFNPISSAWEDEEGRQLIINEIISARMELA